jgi:hypothetical protein
LVSEAEEARLLRVKCGEFGAVKREHLLTRLQEYASNGSDQVATREAR